MPAMLTRHLCVARRWCALMPSSTSFVRGGNSNDVVRRNNRRPPTYRRRRDTGDVFGTMAREGGEQGPRQRLHRFDRFNSRVVDERQQRELRNLLSDDTRWAEEMHSGAPIHAGRYRQRCEALIAAGNLEDAAASLDQLLADDRCRPTPRNFNVLIVAMAREGRTKEAFSYVKKMQLASVEPDPYTYVCLLMACKHHKNREVALQTAQQIYDTIIERHDEVNVDQFHAFMTVYATHGDWPSVLRMYRNLRLAGHMPTQITLQQMMRACVTDVQGGYAKACVIWRFAETLHLPLAHQFTSTFLKCCITSQMGSARTAIDFQRDLRQAHDVSGDSDSTKPPELPSDEDEMLRILPGMTFDQVKAHIDTTSSSVEVSEEAKADREVVEERSAEDGKQSTRTTAVQRFSFAFNDGLDGFIRLMRSRKAEVNERMLTQLLEVIPVTPQALDTLLDLFRKNRLTVDQYFLNIAVKSAAIQGNKALINEYILPLFAAHKVSMTSHTWSARAIAVDSVAEADHLMKTCLKEHGEPRTLTYMTTMFIGRALRGDDFNFGADILKLMNEYDIRMEHRTTQAVLRKIDVWRAIQVAQERGDDRVTAREEQIAAFKKFRNMWDKLCAVGG